MKNAKLIVAAGTFVVFIMATAANATITGLSVFAEPVSGGGAPPTGGPRTIYRAYANFTNTTDHVNAWGIGGVFGPGSILNLNAAGTGPGTGFTNIGGAAGNLAPPTNNTPRDWDCYATIGVLYGSEAPGGIDATAILPGTPQFIVGTSWIPDLTNGGGYFIGPMIRRDAPTTASPATTPIIASCSCSSSSTLDRMLGAP